MGDNRMSVKITLVGVDGKQRQIDWWVNWTSDRPGEIYKEMILLAEKCGLIVDDDHDEMGNPYT